MNYSFLGKGLAYPFSLEKSSYIKMSEMEKNIEESIEIILSTKYGERIMNPNFGCRIHELIFSLNTVDTHNLIVYYVSEALKKWENRIVIENISVEKSGSVSVDINIEYRIKDTNSFYNLVYPFYLTEYR